jgi:hypothetical protein
MDPLKQTLIALALGAGGAFVFFSAFGRLRLWRIMGNTPTAKARSAPMGLAELSGQAMEEGPLLPGPLSAVTCVWWRFTVEEERTRTDSKGRTETYWATLTDERSDAPFLLQDPTGQIRIDPKGAEVDSPARLAQVSGGLFGKAAPSGPKAGLYPGSWGRRMRYTEWRIEPARTLYALGYLHNSGAGADPERPTLGLGRNGEPFFLATKTEAEARRDLYWGVAGRLVLGTVLFAAGIALLTGCFGS